MEEGVEKEEKEEREVSILSLTLTDLTASDDEEQAALAREHKLELAAARSER